MPSETTIDQISEVFVSGWKMGLKAVAINRDGSKRSQPLNLKKEQKKSEPAATPAAAPLAAPAFAPRRQRMPATALSLRHKFEVGGHEGYIHVGLFNDQQPGEVFITMAKEGSTVGGMMDAFATAISLCLQYGVPLEALVKKFSHQRFEPNGMTSNPDIPFAKSIVDYIFRWLGMEFSDPQRTNQSIKRPVRLERTAAGEGVTEEIAPEVNGAGGTAGKDVSIPGAGSYVSESGDGGNGSHQASAASAAAAVKMENRLSGVMQRIDQQFSHFQEDAPACDVCGSITVRNGSCYKCFNCGASLGCS
jgi:ribonucleoside-diphosphate reductase alpha chain